MTTEFKTGPEVVTSRWQKEKETTKEELENDCHRRLEDNGDGLGRGRTDCREQTDVAVLRFIETICTKDHVAACAAEADHTAGKVASGVLPSRSNCVLLAAVALLIPLALGKSP